MVEKCAPDDLTLFHSVHHRALCNYDYHIFRRHDDYVLAVCAVGTPRSGVVAHPYLVAVVFIPGFHLARHHCFYPMLRQYLSACPFAAVEQQLPEFRQRFGLDVKSPTACVVAFRTNFPLYVPDVHRFEQPRTKILEQCFACYFLDDCRKHVSAKRIVFERFSGRAYRFRKVAAHPVATVVSHIPVGFDAGLHCQ